MAPLTNIEMLTELHRLLDELERLVCQQLGHEDANFDDIIETMKIVPSKKDNKALKQVVPPGDRFYQNWIHRRMRLSLKPGLTI